MLATLRSWQRASPDTAVENLKKAGTIREMTNTTRALPYGVKASLNRLLAEPDLELKLVAGSVARADREMHGIHLTEILEVDKWLAEGWVMMTTGVLLHRNPQAQRTLIRVLHGMNATGLGYCLDIVTRNVPAALLDEARKLGFPLFAMPLHIKARDVATRANRMILANDDTMFQQALSTQDVFFERFDAVADTDWLPERQLVDNLAVLLDLPVSFHSNDGQVPAGDDGIGRLLSTAPTHAPIKQSNGSEDLLIVPARVGSIFVGWVVVALSHGRDWQVAMNMTVAVARLVALAVLSRKRPATNDRAIRQELMGQVLAMDSARSDGVDVVRLLGQNGALTSLQGLGFEPGKAVRASVIENSSGDGIIDTLHRLGLPYIFLHRDGVLHLMTQVPLPELLAAFEANEGTIGGVGGEVDNVTDLRRSLDQAAAAIHTARAEVGQQGLPDVGRCVVFDDMPISAWMIYNDRLASPIDKAEREVAALRANEAVFETVVTYFATGLDVAACADKLFIHPNSVRYRLSRAEATLQVSLQNPAVISDLYLALRVLGEL